MKVRICTLSVHRKISCMFVGSSCGFISSPSWHRCQVWRGAESQCIARFAASAVQNERYDYPLAAPGYLEFRLSHVPQHACWPHIQRSRSVSNLPLGHLELRFSRAGHQRSCKLSRSFDGLFPSMHILSSRHNFCFFPRSKTNKTNFSPNLFSHLLIFYNIAQFASTKI